MKDHLGSTRAVFNDAGTVVEARDYYPFGLEMPNRTYRSGGAPEETKEKFTGKELDIETKLYHFGARLYDAAIGRFASVDPHADSYPSLSSYNYCGNNPINFIDPAGMDSTDDQSSEDQEENQEEENQNENEQELTAKQEAAYNVLVQSGVDPEVAMALISIMNAGGQSAGAVKDFITQYLIMREQNVQLNDHYHHAMANSKAALRGAWGKMMASLLSNAREGFDFLKGDNIGMMREDQTANRHGRNIPKGISPSEHNKIFDARRGGSRATITPKPGDNITILDVISATLIRF